ncbi:VOC family protein [Oligoflexaceae bacterium]|nr:VOC family protein [Oligoflexaceae bacterium]
MLGTHDYVGFIPTADLQSAKEFYQSTLGLTLKSEDQFAIAFKVNGRFLRVTKVEKFEPFPFTISGWEVSDIEDVAASLKERGVRFERFSGMDQSELGVWQSPSGAKVAWFKDPDGNVLSISEY